MGIPADFGTPIYPTTKSCVQWNHLMAQENCGGCCNVMYGKGKNPAAMSL